MPSVKLGFKNGYLSLYKTGKGTGTDITIGDCE